MRLIEQFVERVKSEQLALPIWFENNALKVLDQKKLPFQEEVYTLFTVEDLAEAIKAMTIRGSGAIGICGAYGVLLAALRSQGDAKEIREAGALLKSTRPTAVNLMKTVDEMLTVVNGPRDEVISKIEKKAVEILERQLEFEYQLGRHGASLIEDGDTIMTHCHSGALGGSGYGGRALSVIRAAHEQGKQIHVYTCETRPYLQGARITAYELKKFGIPYTLITDSMSGFCMSQGMIQKVVVGSDRVSANGDLANKIGTYMHALAAHQHNIPFYTATSSHTIDFDTESGKYIEVEMRAADEVTHFNKSAIAPEGTQALYPSFDITPNELISGIITEKGVFKAPYETNLKELLQKESFLQK
ncbi:S-methyl-5-thioribose-1-phosphate isomerase [Pontibacillus yanchengensis]|uniref:S-methyl-5-thioribose-1-phosphate isomerase n=2 Tax=Pontibacillus yanchengensis TaxID=462910 RepID=A0ACC7VIT8_9BACI|nr:S-methyl-5-thioribose-1-phosphate isomerase [Pontibacillus yanchengensis]MYL34391.1 S-methyl-5-thioribose-1-phosphate isomerase [Pontibacillus yanchengensis]MYL53859.1 S-methyl-5-thioribose-1-phosphate isomerase [Pontibacillus yanchengensis]